MTPREKELKAKVQQQQQELQRLRHENLLLRQKVDYLSRKIFGCSSEKLSSDQLQLLLDMAMGPIPAVEEPKEEAQPPVTTSRVKKDRKPRIPENLPVTEEVLDPEEVKANPEQWRQIGQEVTEQIDFEPSRFVVRRLVRRTFVSRVNKDLPPITAPLPACLQERSIAAPGLLAQVVVSKYCDHLPLYRQEKIYEQRHGVSIPRQTLAGWIDLVSDWLKPIYGHIREAVYSKGYVQIDETPVRYLSPGEGKASQGYFWVANRPGAEVVFDWKTSRAAACLESILPADFRGIVQCDGYAGYEAMHSQRQGKVELAGCWAHARRKFFEAMDSAPRTVGWILRQFKHLYRVEAQLRDAGLSPKLREIHRASESTMIALRLKNACIRLRQNGKHFPQSALGRAMNYFLSQWEGLNVFLRAGAVEIDNNLVENAIRPTAIGKKNWLFIGEAQAGERSAILYTIIENCRRLGINPYEYLKDVLTRLPSMTNHYTHTLAPSAWLNASQGQQLKLAS